MHHPTDRITHTTAFVTPVVEHWLEREKKKNKKKKKNNNNNNNNNNNKTRRWVGKIKEINASSSNIMMFVLV